MADLHPLALTYQSVLRALAADAAPAAPWTLSSLAKAAGKDKSTLRRALAALREADLLAPEPDFAIGAAGRAALALLDGAAAPGEADEANGVRVAAAGGHDAPLGYQAIRHALIVPDVLNPRDEFDPEALAELAASIARDGLLQNLVVRPAEPYQGGPFMMHRLVAGERRWRAIGRLIEAGEWPRDRLIPCHVVDLDDTGHAVIALLENLQRKDLKPLEEARAFRRLVDDHGFKTAAIAERINATQRVVQQRLQLLELSAADQKKLDEGTLSLEQARQALANRPKPFNLPPAQKLILLEVAHAVSREGNSDYLWKKVPAGAPPQNDPAAIALQKAYLVEHSSDWTTAEYRVGLGYPGRRALAEVVARADPDHAEIAVALDHQRAVAGLGPFRGTYATAWLNRPFALDRQRLERIEQDRARDAQMREDEAQARAVQLARKAELRAIEAQLKAGTAIADSPLPAALAAAGLVAPFYVSDDELYDAAGQCVAAMNWNSGIARDNRTPAMRLIALTLNAALGFPPPSREAGDGDGAGDEAQFIAWIADQLLTVCGAPADRLTEIANHVYSAALERADTYFGEACLDWTEAQARAWANEGWGDLLEDGHLNGEALADEAAA